MTNALPRSYRIIADHIIGGTTAESLSVSAGTISESSDPDSQVLDLSGHIVAPGFLDLQVNGGYGIDLVQEPHRVGELAAKLTRHGVTGWLPTIISSQSSVRDAAVQQMNSAARDETAAQILGFHLEGPMLNPKRRGAHRLEDLAAPLDVLSDIAETDRAKLVTLAPELQGGHFAVKKLVEAGIAVSIGHSDATAADVVAAEELGATYVTHLFNAMAPFHHREAGVLGALAGHSDLVAGLICDLIHVEPNAVNVAWKILGPDRTNLVTDAMAALGMADGETTRLADTDVKVIGRRVETADGTLAGAAVGLEECLANLIAVTGCSVSDAVATVTSTPARILGDPTRGHLAPGARADITVLDQDLNVVATIVGGQLAFSSERNLRWK